MSETIEHNFKKIDMSVNKNTHRTSSHFGSLIFKPFYDNNTMNLTFNGEILEQNIEIKGSLLIVENLDVFNFILKNENGLKKLDIHEPYLNIVFGSGTSITKREYYPFFNAFDTVYYFGDLDCGGFQIFKTIKINLTTIVKHTYVNNVESYFAKIKEKNSYKHPHKFKSMFKYIQTHKEIFSREDLEVLKLIDTYDFGIEQELFFNKEFD